MSGYFYQWRHRAGTFRNIKKTRKLIDCPSNRVPSFDVKLAKIRFESDAACARALKGLASRMRITVLADESFIVPEAGVEWLRAEGLAFQILEWVNQDNVIQALRDNLANPV